MSKNVDLGNPSKNFINNTHCCTELNDKYNKGFDDWLKAEDVEISKEGIYLNGVELREGDTLIKIYESCD
jgi:hypothetical protein